MSEKDCEIECSLVLYDPPDLLALEEAFRAYPIISKFIIKSDLFRDGIQTLDDSCSQVTLSTTPSLFKLSSQGVAGESLIEFKNPILEGFQCQSASFSYQLEKLKNLTKSLFLSSKTLVRLNRLGILSLQVFI